MKAHSTGDSICYRPATPDSGLVWGRVVAVDHRVPKSGEVTGYQVNPDDTSYVVQVDAAQVVDLDQVSDDASAALERIYRSERARAGILDQLLGELSYYVECGADLVFDHQIGELHPNTRVRKPLSEIVDQYTERRDRAV